VARRSSPRCATSHGGPTSPSDPAIIMLREEAGHPAGAQVFRLAPTDLAEIDEIAAPPNPTKHHAMSITSQAELLKAHRDLWSGNAAAGSSGQPAAQPALREWPPITRWSGTPAQSPKNSGLAAGSLLSASGRAKLRRSDPRTNRSDRDEPCAKGSSLASRDLETEVICVFVSFT